MSKLTLTLQTRDALLAIGLYTDHNGVPSVYRLATDAGPDMAARLEHKLKLAVAPYADGAVEVEIQPAIFVGYPPANERLVIVLRPLDEPTMLTTFEIFATISSPEFKTRFAGAKSSLSLWCSADAL